MKRRPGQALAWINTQQSLTPDKPFFLYFATGVTHAPHHAPKPADIKAWDALAPDEKRLFDRQMELFAGFAEHTDYEVGRLVAALEARGEPENTVFLYIVGANGSSAEGGMIGMYNDNTPVVLSCKAKDRFPGKIGSVTIETFPGKT